jgi:F5/8 type C domain/PEP-CTERM motif
MMWRNVLIAACVMCLSGTAHAAVVSSVETDKAPTGAPPGDPYSPTFPSGGPSSIDVLEGVLPIDSAGNFQVEDSAGVAALTNGSVATFYGNQMADSNHSAYATAGNGGSSGQYVVYALGGPHNVSSIVVYGGWNDAGRDAQHYDLLTSTDGVSFNPLGSIDINPGVQGTDTTPVSNRVAFTDDALPNLATEVTHIRLNFLAVENGYTGYTEIDVFGTLVPEPSSAALLSVGLLGFAALRRRA